MIHKNFEAILKGWEENKTIQTLATWNARNRINKCCFFFPFQALAFAASSREIKFIVFLIQNFSWVSQNCI